MAVYTLDGAGREFLPKLIAAARQVVSHDDISLPSERVDVTVLRDVLREIDSIHWVDLFTTSRL